MQQYFERPAVAGDVVQYEAEHVVVGSEPDEGEPQHRAVFEVEGAVGALGHERPGAFLVRPVGQVDTFESWSARADRLETRPSRSAKVLRSMSCRPTSSVSTRSRSSTSRAPLMRNVTGMLYETSAGSSRCRNQSRSWAEHSAAERAGPGGAAPGAGGRAVLGTEPGDERGRPGDGRLLEEVVERHLGAQFGAHPGDDLRGQQGVAAELEEAGPRVDRVGAEDLAPDAPHGGGQLARRGALLQLGIHGFTCPTAGPADC